ncbi:MAG: LysE family transporter [Chitinophagaceae bacterium]|nr:LysE family transporter [Chitinophagaceae bacterium]
MKQRSVQLFYWGMLISFLGSLPPGVMNIVATQISSRQGTGQAMIYAIGSMLAEVIIVRVALSGMNRLIRSQLFFRILEWMTAGLLVVFSIACFGTANSVQHASGILPDIVLPPFVTGILISAVNPLHIPFWLGWSTVLIEKNILGTRSRQYNIYVTGIATGTIAGFSLFIAGGHYLLQELQSYQFVVNIAIGFVLCIVAFFHIRKIVMVPAAVRYAKLFRQP